MLVVVNNKCHKIRKFAIYLFNSATLVFGGFKSAALNFKFSVPTIAEICPTHDILDDRGNKETQLFVCGPGQPAKPSQAKLDQASQPGAAKPSWTRPASQGQPSKTGPGQPATGIQAKPDQVSQPGQASPAGPGQPARGSQAGPDQASQPGAAKPGRTRQASQWQPSQAGPGQPARGSQARPDQASQPGQPSQAGPDQIIHHRKAGLSWVLKIKNAYLQTSLCTVQ